MSRKRYRLDAKESVRQADSLRRYKKEKAGFYAGLRKMYMETCQTRRLTEEFLGGTDRTPPPR